MNQRLYMKSETLKLLQENVCITLQDLDVVISVSIVQELRSAIDKRNLRTLKSFCTAMETTNLGQKKWDWRESLLSIYLAED